LATDPIWWEQEFRFTLNQSFEGLPTPYQLIMKKSPRRDLHPDGAGYSRLHSNLPREVDHCDWQTVWGLTPLFSFSLLSSLNQSYAEAEPPCFDYERQMRAYPTNAIDGRRICLR